MRVRVESEVKINLKTRAKLIIYVKLTLLVSLSSPLKLTNLEYINFRGTKSNIKPLRKFFIFCAILLILIRFFFKQLAILLCIEFLKLQNSQFIKKTKFKKNLLRIKKKFDYIIKYAM